MGQGLGCRRLNALAPDLLSRDPPAGHSGKRGHAHRRGRREAAEAEAWAAAECFFSLAALCKSRSVFKLSYLMAPVECRALQVYFIV